MDQSQIDYVKTELDRGVTPEALQGALTEAGYTPEQIENLLQTAQGQMPVNMGTATVATTGMPLWVKILIGVVVGLIVTVFALSTLVLGSLNTARDQASEASAKMSLNNIRSQAEVHFAGNAYSYTGMCEQQTISSLLQTAVGLADCRALEKQYRVSLPLTNGYYCIDSSGFSDEVFEEPTGTACTL